MARLGEVLPFKGSSGAPVLGISRGHGEESVVCTSTNGQVAVYDVPTRLALNTWLVTPPDTITVHAHYVPKVGVYMAVKNNTELLYWRTSVTFAADFNVLKLEQPVYSLLTTPTIEAAVVVYKEGTIDVVKMEEEELIAVSSHTRRKKKAKASPKSVCGAVLIHHDDVPFVVVVAMAKTQCHASLYSLADLSIKEVGVVPIEHQELKDIASVKASSSTLYLTNAKGRVFRAPLSSLVTNTQLHVDTVIELGCPTGLSCFNNGAVVTLSGCGLSVYESKYHTPQASVQLQDTSLTLDKYHHGYLFLHSTAGELFSCSLSFSLLPSLASALGRGTHREALSGEVGVVCGTPGKLAGQINDFKSPNTTSKDKHKICKKLLKHLATPTSAPSVILMLPQITKFLLDCEGNHLNEEHPVGGDLGAWHPKELMELVQLGVYPVSLSDCLYAKALQSSNWSLVAESLRYVQCIQCNTIVRLLESLLSLPKELSFTVNDETLMKDQLVWRVLSLPRNDVELLKSLVKLKQESVITLLELLSQYIETCSCTQSSTDQWCRFEDALEWMGLVLDSHFTRLILVPNLRPRIAQLRANVYKQMRTISNLSVLATVNAAMTTANKRVEQHSNWLYKMDRLEIDF